MIHLFTNGLPSCGSPLTENFWAEQINPNGQWCPICHLLSKQALSVAPRPSLGRNADMPNYLFTASRLYCYDCEDVWVPMQHAKNLERHAQEIHGRTATRDERTPR